MNLEQARYNMVEQQVRPWGVSNPDVLDAMFKLKREDFVPAAYRNFAYADTEIPLGHGATMLIPQIEAHALQALQLDKHAKVLEVGTGSGYMAALLATIADQVWSVEAVPALAATARANLSRAGIANVSVEQGDGLTGLPAFGPFDAIMLSGSVNAVPRALLDQLKPGGRLFAIVGPGPAMQAQVITRVGEGGHATQTLLETVAAPLTGGTAPPAFQF
ncbi:protein-L-isoaspartate O-methyltransferase family protein [Denitratisoma oestradiolicum]|uniref:Protein-L-isoaspartate O-methyltransferase n=1 Tax=Denitratisoma oestradiolicum TaxID=311182 RepID=A0A6S6XTF9_9PROT|nr:protein-L-isoaspartate O-methyltransferase [Denitratisoma oestradiolicum]TWO79688.1 protein-L-isoaspartate O-methyltransferase [Denitratisoma oestradiolicum]CAB1367443.1 Protein-L-isoaspartate O-methyltransferase [Denitratisoma oestradiolicum]